MDHPTSEPDPSKKKENIAGGESTLCYLFYRLSTLSWQFKLNKTIWACFFCKLKHLRVASKLQPPQSHHLNLPSVPWQYQHSARTVRARRNGILSHGSIAKSLLSLSRDLGVDLKNVRLKAKGRLIYFLMVNGHSMIPFMNRVYLVGVARIPKHRDTIKFSWNECPCQ